MMSIHDIAGVDARCRELGIDPFQLKRFRNAFYKKHVGAETALNELPAAQRARFAADFEFETLTLVRRLDSDLDGASKLVFRTGQGYLIESVMLRVATGRTALCVSCQVGCAANCAFCATGKMGMAHALCYSEILDQVVQANRLLAAEGRAIRNVVFMGMGEPFHNEPNLYRALDVLNSPRCFDLAPQRTLVSTVGLAEPMVRFARRFPDVHLALSLHSANQTARERIIPLARRCTLDDLRQALREVTTIQQQPVMIEYLLLKDINDTPADVAALGNYLRDLPVHINLIPFNPIAAAPELQGTDTEQRAQFAAALKAAGFRVTIRYSLGADIAAACGQLVQSENRRITSLASPSS